MYFNQELIASNEKYELAVNKDKNRIFVRIFGFWKSPDEVPEYLNDWQKAVKLVEPGFTVIADMKLMKTHPKELMDIHQAAIDITQKAGVGAAASVINYDIAEMQMDRLYREKQVEKFRFNNLKDAEDFLDSHG